METILLLQANPVFFLSIIFILGLLIGSFLNVVAYRLPVMMEKSWQKECKDYLKLADDSNTEEAPFNLMHPRSKCQNCGHQITAWENIPVISYLILRGRCRSCKTSISAFYPSVELATGLLSVVVAYQFGPSIQTVFALIFTWALIPACLIDLRHMLLPDSITLPLMWLGLLVNMESIFTTLEGAVLGAVGGYLILWGVFHLFKIVTGKEGMGHGDFKLLALIGAWAGLSSLPLVIVLSSVAGTIVGVSMIVFGNHNKANPIPFGPYLAIGGWIALLWGPQITQQYLHFLNS